VCEMITARAIVERDDKTMHMITFGPDEQPRSLQLYGVDPATIRGSHQDQLRELIPME
jgi:tRNA-dihydrouridine synthase